MKRRSAPRGSRPRTLGSDPPALARQCAPNHFTELGRTLDRLRAHEDWADLHLICQPDDQDPKTGLTRTLHAHRALFMATSPLLSQCFEQAHQQAPGCPLYVTLVGVDPDLVEKMLECLYVGHTTLQKSEERQALNGVWHSLGLTRCRLSLDDDDVVEIPAPSPPSPRPSSRASYSPSSPSESSLTPPTKLSPRKTGPRSKAKGTEKKADRVSPDAAPTESELKAKARRSISRVTLDRVDQSSDREVQRLYEQASAAEAKSKTPVPQKRRIAETSDKKANIPKKMKADETSSEYDSDEVQARRKEALISKRSASAQRKPMPPPRNRRSAATAMATSSGRDPSQDRKAQEPQVVVRGVPKMWNCYCGRKFLTEASLQLHEAKFHGESTESDETPSDHDEVTESDQVVKTSARNGKKKSSAKIRQERRQSRRSSSSNSDWSEDEVSRSVRKPTSHERKLGKNNEAPSANSNGALRSKSSSTDLPIQAQMAKAPEEPNKKRRRDSADAGQSDEVVPEHTTGSDQSKETLPSPVVFNDSDSDDFLGKSYESGVMKSFDELFNEAQEPKQ
ncbi:hypothetical protein TCAL_00725 [Tigriopus californicus]|uniref:BTB domain-containing protein n=1 Tax=Tigriopus californicus TaxID=6832 RepID=A0A553PCU9_TIGCA|nr:serine/arginine repetitive matrix protein 1-like [Tigriopus californicus]TRY75509.1 hypothetical protein TCAL_00725 [Tigriopus californicus]|eukprot:TCALIF_00725-PA protein Name:"Protein of unknown function" AED:0.00 eAED:0.00 QI:128/1/1/1/1/1/3/93/564